MKRGNVLRFCGRTLPAGIPSEQRFPVQSYA